MVTPGEETELRAEIDAAITRGDAVQTRALLERLWRQRPGPALAGFVLGRVKQLPPAARQRTATVAVVRSFTIEPVVPVARAAAAINGIDLTVHVGDYNTYGQDLLDPSRALHTEWAADVVIVAVQLRDVAPELADQFTRSTPEQIDAAFQRVVDQFTGLVNGFRRLSDATLVVHGFEQPATAALGLADRTATRSQRGLIDELNDLLARLADAHRDVHVLDYDALVARTGRASWHDHVKWHSMKAPVRADHLAALADEWLRFLHPAIGKVAKALVVDLDGTLWGGVLGEDGLAAIRVGPASSGAGFAALQRTLLDVRARGILLAICSKNNHADVIEALTTHDEMLLRPDDFSVIRANWNSKVDNLRSIAAELNIGLDSIAFLDDNPVEADLVRQLLPDVTVIQLDREPTDDDNPIATNPLFERLRVIAEDRERADFYRNEQARRETMEASESLDGFLHSLGTTVVVNAATGADVERAAQLTQKTNQFNLTTRRYTEQEIERFLRDPAREVLVARAADRFGDHGLIGVVITTATDDAWVIDTMLLSCRVIGRGVERAILAVVAEHARAAGSPAIAGEFIPTAKNAPASRFYEEVGFVRADEPAATGATWWRFDLGGRDIEAPAWIDLRLTEDAR